MQSIFEVLFLIGNPGKISKPVFPKLIFCLNTDKMATQK